MICRNTKAEELITDASGAVVGVKATNLVTGTAHQFSCKAVVLSAGGFGSNVEMRMKYNPRWTRRSCRPTRWAQRATAT